MNQVGIVAPRWHPSVVGGAETLAWQWATLLKNRYETELLTTTALDLATWANDLPCSATMEEGVRVRRFRVSQGRSSYWHELHKRLLAAHQSASLPSEGRPAHPTRWSQALQEEFIYRQGPYSAELCRFLAESWHQYRALIFLPYLYPTTYFPAQLIPRALFILAPLLHDEAPAHLPAYGRIVRRARAVLWNTPAERSLGEAIWGPLPGRIAGKGIETDYRPAAEIGFPYLLYSGRIDPHKGCGTLVDHFLRYKQAKPSALRLVLTGRDEMGLPNHPDIDFRGFVSEEEKFGLMSGALLFALLSPYESLSISTLEAMAQKTPVLVSARSEVLVEHIRLSGGGFTCADYGDFERALDTVLTTPDKGREMGRLGRKYVLANYCYSRVQEVLFETIEQALPARALEERRAGGMENGQRLT